MNIIDLTRKFKKDLEKQDIHLLWWVSALYNKYLKKIQSKYEELVSEIYNNPQAKTNQINKIEAVKVTLKETEKIYINLEMQVAEAIKTSQNAAENAAIQHTETVFDRVKETLKKTVSNLSSDTADENQQKSTKKHPQSSEDDSPLINMGHSEEKQKEEKTAEKEPKTEPKTEPKPNTSNTVKEDTEKNIKAKTEKGEPLEKTVSEHSMTPEKVIKTLREGIAKGKTEKQIAKEMVQSGYEDKKRALRIARTELMKTAHDVSLENYRKNGVEEVIWVSGETAHTCAACWAMSGRRFKIDEVPYDHPNGRCQLSPYLPELEEFNPEAYNHDTEAEFNRLTEDEQKNILGKTGFDLWKKGEAKLSDFAEIKDNDIWGRQISLKSAESLKKKGIKTEKPTENSKAKKTEKIPEKNGKKTASELTNDDKISYNISEDKNKATGENGYNKKWNKLFDNKFIFDNKVELISVIKDFIQNNKTFKFHRQHLHLIIDGKRHSGKTAIIAKNKNNEEILNNLREIFEKYKGTGELEITKNNKWEHKEVIILTSEDIEKYQLYYENDNKSGIITKFKIHYGKKTFHLVPKLKD